MDGVVTTRTQVLIDFFDHSQFGSGEGASNYDINLKDYGTYITNLSFCPLKLSKSEVQNLDINSYYSICFKLNYQIKTTANYNKGDIVDYPICINGYSPFTASVSSRQEIDYKGSLNVNLKFFVSDSEGVKYLTGIDLGLNDVNDSGIYQNNNVVVITDGATGLVFDKFMTIPFKLRFLTLDDITNTYNLLLITPEFIAGLVNKIDFSISNFFTDLPNSILVKPSNIETFNLSSFGG